MSQAPRDHQGRSIDFGRTAHDYDRHRPGFPPSFYARVEALGWVRGGLRCLDLGTGTGDLALGLASRGLEVTGLDISADLLAVAKQRAAERQLDVSLVQGPAESTRFDDATFNLITAGQCWWWFDVESVAREISRILLPGGRVVIANFSYLPLPESIAERTEALVLRHNPGWTMAGSAGVYPEQIAALDRAGFDDVESFTYVESVDFTHEAWRGRMRACNGVGASLDDASIVAFDRDLVELLHHNCPESFAVAHRISVTSGRRPA